MPILTFTASNDSYTVTGSDTYTLNFLAGDDTLDVRGGTFTTAHMGDGADRAYLRSGDALVNGEAGADRFDVYGSGFEAHGGLDNDLFYLRGGNDLNLYGDGGSDRFNFVDGGTGLLLRGGSGDDDFFGYGKAIGGTIYGDSGNDYFVTFSNALGGVILRGNTGNDIYRHHAGSSASFVELADQGTDSVQVARGITYVLPANIENISVSGFSGSTADATGLNGNALNNTIIAHNNVDTILGNEGNDRLFGKGSGDFLYGYSGDDYLDGGDAIDQLHGGDGNDVLQGRAGDDTMVGGDGNDTYYVDEFSGDIVTENPDQGTDLVRVSEGGYILPENVENAIIGGIGNFSIDGNDGDNEITGNSGENWIQGWLGDDTLRGGGADDYIEAGGGDDILSGGADADYLEGMAGADTITGGDGADEYFFNNVAHSAPGSADSITDFVTADDVIYLNNIDANINADANQAFVYNGLTPQAYSIWYTYTDLGGGVFDVIYYGDVNGDTVPELEIHVHQIGFLDPNEDIMF